MKYLIAATLSVFLFSASGQGDYLVTLKNDTLFGKINLLAGASYDEVFLKRDRKKESFPVYTLKFVNYKSDRYLPISFEGRQIIAKEEINGSLGLFRIREKDKFEFGTKVLIKENGDQMRIPSMGFKKLMSEFFQDCPNLASKIEIGTYKLGDLNEIINEYNTSCVNPIVELGATSDLKDLHLLLSDLYSKIDKNEAIPAYLKKALKEYENQDLKRMINELLNKIEE